MTGPRASGPAGASEPFPGDGARAPSGARTGNPGSICATTHADPASARIDRAGAGVETKPQMRSCRFPDMAPFPRNQRPAACSLPNRDMRPLHRLNRSATFDPPRRTPPFGRAGGGRARGLPHRVSRRLLPAINGARQEKKMPFAGDSMPREHWTAGMPGRLVPAGSATLSRHGFPGCERHTCFNAGKTDLAIDPCCARFRSRTASGAPSRRLNAMDRRCPAGIGGRPDRAANCVDRPGTRDRSRE